MSDNAKPTDAPDGNCGWENCDYIARGWRFGGGGHGWLPVCFRHSERGEVFYSDLDQAYNNTKGAHA